MGQTVRAGQSELHIPQDAIERILPHRERALHIVSGATISTHDRRGQTVRTVTVQDCEGHFPGEPLFPGKEYAEIIAQLLGVIAAHLYGHLGLGFLASVGKCKFRSFARPGDVLLVSAWITNESPTRLCGSGEVHGANGRLIATVDDILIICRPQSP